jgi:hypothetical protein
LSERYAGWIETADERFRRCILPQSFCAVIVGEVCSESHGISFVRRGTLVVANSHPVVADSHSNKDGQPDASFAFAEKLTLRPNFCWSGY